MGDIPTFEQLSSTQPHLPLMTREKFAQLLGVPSGVVIGWCDRGYLPMLKIGKYSLVNLALLQKQCLDREFK